jgi:hypothetical protein
VSGGFDVSHCERDYLDRAACALRAVKWHTMASDDHQAECPDPVKL